MSMERTTETTSDAESISITPRPHRHGPRQLRVLSALLLVFFVTFAGKPLLGQQASLKKLTLAQIEELVTHGVPDSTLGAQIEKRGVDFAATPATIELLRAKGAGLRTLAAIANTKRPEVVPQTHPSEPGAKPRAAKAMTRSQLDHLIHIRASDGFIAEQLHARGLAFPLSNAAVSSLAAQGAGQRTVQELRSLVTTGTIQLLTTPGTAVSLDGQPAGVSDAQGIVIIQDVLPGPHSLALSKTGFQPAQQTLQISNNETAHLSNPLKWAGALLTISAQPSTAEIAVSGPQNFSGALNAQQCPPGAYTITVSQPGYLSQTRSIALSAGENHEEHFDLAVDPAFLAHEIEMAKSDLASGNSAAAASIAHTVLIADGSNGPAREVLAEATFLNGDMGYFVQDALAAVRDGQTVTVPLIHVHASFSHASLERANMMISQTGLSFNCAREGKCDLPESLNYDQLAGVVIGANQQVKPTLRIHWTKHPHGLLLHDLDFVPAGAHLEKSAPPPNTVFYVSHEFVRLPTNTTDEYRAIILLVRQLSGN